MALSVGFLAKEDGKSVTLTEAICEDEDVQRKYGCSTYTPKAYITKRKFLK